MASIRRELLVTLVGAVLAAGLAAAFAIYQTTRAEVGALLDYQMQQMALAVRDALGGQGVIRPPPFGLDYAIQISSADGVQLYYSRTRVQLPPITGSGFQRVDTAEGPWRVYTLHEGGIAVQVGQPTRVRDQLAARAAWRTMTPFILMVPLLAAFVWFAVKRGLYPLQSLAQALQARSPRSLDPLPERNLPEEIRPVVLALNDLLPRLSRALEMQRAFIADAAHELRTPLTALRLQLQLAQRAKDTAERETAIESLRLGLARATHLVEQLLTLAREEPAGAHGAAEDVDLGSLAREVVQLHAPFAAQKAIALAAAPVAPPAVVRGEREALRTVLSNLVDNAVRYTPNDGRVDVEVTREGRSVTVTVRDTGPGIPADERERVFDRFYRRPGTDLPGSGLGLAIVRSIAERHGAKIVLDATPAGGLAARLIFPVFAEDAGAPAAPSRSSSAS